MMCINLLLLLVVRGGGVVVCGVVGIGLGGSREPRICQKQKKYIFIPYSSTNEVSSFFNSIFLYRFRRRGKEKEREREKGELLIFIFFFFVFLRKS